MCPVLVFTARLGLAEQMGEASLGNDELVELGDGGVNVARVDDADARAVHKISVVEESITAKREGQRSTAKHERVLGGAY